MTIGDIVDKWWWLMVIMIDLMMILIMVPDKQTTLDAQSHYLISSVECTFVSENVWDYEEHLLELYSNPTLMEGV